MARAYLGLGSNVGDRRRHLAEALQALRALPHTTVPAVSTMREYAPVGGPPQGPYLNAAALLETTLPPRELLQHLRTIESRLGRVRAHEVRWGPRTMDLDLLLYEQQQLKEPDCTVPHPRLAERLFVLEPLAEIAPEAIHPSTGLTITALLEQRRAAATS